MDTRAFEGVLVSVQFKRMGYLEAKKAAALRRSLSFTSFMSGFLGLLMITAVLTRDGKATLGVYQNGRGSDFTAICRYQTYCNLFGPEQKMEKAPLPLDDRGIDFEAVDSFLPNFLPWEVQEMACIYKYLITRWAYLLREICLSEPEEPKTVDESASELDWDNLFAHIRSLPISCQGIFLIAYELCLVPG